MNPSDQFKKDVAANIKAQGNNTELKELSIAWIRETAATQYSYNFTWMDRPIIQFPQDMVAMHELIWSIKPDLIIEAGIAHGGSIIYSASMLALLDLCDAVEADTTIRAGESRRKVLGIDIDIRPHNLAAIEAHPMASRITMIEGSSIAPETIKQVEIFALDYNRILVILDSNHTHEHVLAELEAYASLTSLDSYCVVFDTLVEDMPADMFPDRPWGPGDNPKTAVWKFLESHPEFEVDEAIENKLLITVGPNGFLKRVR